jgi:pyruvate formate lyase activating enzyme
VAFAIEEVGRVAPFVANIELRTPYALLAFAPNFYMPELPRTSVTPSKAAQAAAKLAGLDNVRVGNLHLLSRKY